MMHMSILQWRKYVQDELLEEERVVYENHLYTCDQCLQLYLQAVAESEADFPTLSNETVIVDAVMGKVEKGTDSLECPTKVESLDLHRTNMSDVNLSQAVETQREHVSQLVKKAQQYDNVIPLKKQQQREQQQKPPFYQAAAFHYLLATAMTLLLMVSGAFSSLIDFADVVEDQGIEREQPSFTEGLLNKTFTLMDEIDEKLKEEPNVKQSEEVGK